ncbi:ABC-2 type transport system ATP-binding protein [Terrimicrobium sacchariphilum]|uniref:ABC-2 type transport system ATP-binding protein n=1 Tax=Terrimicrobium sacchariphilum TaxID=690879 RepID=A0A146G7R8_TERSA|nr:ABC transporter ATP-binding protein [Terrimicrobium sacchariphilum]GAT33749.1 ABC-2 type transport system ATP-binding protein [Terrimicrobium sacchariphilum]
MSEYVIETQGLTKYFGKTCVVSELNLKVPKGSIFGFLGRNGAGKSTTIRMLLGLVEPSRGSAQVLGKDCWNLSPDDRARIGYLPEGHHVYGWMTIEECGKFQAAFYKHWNASIFEAVLSHFRLDRKGRAGNLSRGQRAGLCLALVLAPEPELLILDDPALGLDPVARRSLIQSMLYVTRTTDRTILFSSHLLSDVERVADEIAVLDLGTLRASCKLETFRQHVRQFVIRHDGNEPPLPDLPGLLQTFRTDTETSLTFANIGPAEIQRIQVLTGNRIEEVPLSLEDAFVTYVGERGAKSFFTKDLEDVK